MGFIGGAAPRSTRAALAALCVVVTLLALIPASVTGTATGAASGASRLSLAATEFSWPLDPPHPVLRPFAPPATDYGAGHRGVDLGGTRGGSVLAAADGLVLYAGRIHDRTLVSVEHSDGLRTTYEPIRPSVRVGQRVIRGQPIGHLQVGHFPCAIPGGRQRACLHWGARRGEDYLDPLRLVSSGAVRLLPERGEPERHR